MQFGRQIDQKQLNVPCLF